MDLQLKNKRALVTGASRGLGLATARGLAGEGCRVAINSRNPGKLADAARQLTEIYGTEVIALPGDQDEHLLVAPADGDDQPAAVAELVEQGDRDVGGSRGHDDPVVGGVLGPAQAAVCALDIDIDVAQLGQALAGGVGQLGDRLDAVHLAGEPAEHSRLVAGAGAELENGVAGL